MSPSNIDPEIRNHAEGLAHGSLSDVAEALVFYKLFRKKLAQDAQLLDSMGCWKEAFVKSLRNSHISPAYMEEIIRILVTDFSVEEVEEELTTYYEHSSLPQQVQLLHVLQVNGGKKFADVLPQLEETIANPPNALKTFNQKRCK